jgi:hypothetical protein
MTEPMTDIPGGHDPNSDDGVHAPGTPLTVRGTYTAFSLGPRKPRLGSEVLIPEQHNYKFPCWGGDCNIYWIGPQ